MGRWRLQQLAAPRGFIRRCISNGASPSRNPLRAAWQQNGNARSGLALVVRLYALVEADDPEAIDVYLREEDAQRALEGACVTSRIGAGC